MGVRGWGGRWGARKIDFLTFVDRGEVGVRVNMCVCMCV